MSQKVKPVPEGYHTVTPYLIISGAAAALDFYKKAFGAKEVFRFAMPDGKIAHAEIKIGDSRIMLGDQPEGPVANSPDHLALRSPKSTGGRTSVGICLYVEDVDALAKQAVAAGAIELKAVTNQFYGDRSGTYEDPFGHIWTISTHIEDVSHEEMMKRAQQQH
jgi:PhnB protein